MSEKGKFALGKRSLERLEGVHPDLVAVVKKAIEISPVDFTVVEGLRTLEREKELYAQGKTQTLKSKHLKQEDGYGHAVDLAPIVDGQIPWNDFEEFETLAAVMAEAANELETPLVWGACWSDIAGKDPKAERAAYIERKKKAGGKPFTDGPHYQLGA